VTNVPTRLKDARRFIESIDLKQIESAVAEEARAQLVIIGPVNSGKSTLFNQLKGQKLSSVSAVPGTTTTLISERFGPFWLVDTPGFGEISGTSRAATALSAVENAAVAILIVDAMAGMRQEDADLLMQVRQAGVPVVVALNKIDLVSKDLKRVVSDIENKLGIPVVPISAKTGAGVADKLMPAIIQAHPRMAVTIGRALPRYRRTASRKVIQDSAWIASLVGGEPIPLVGLPFLVGVQIGMLLRLATIYGEEMGAARARELLTAIAGGAAIRYAAQELVKLIPGPGWLIAGAAAWTGTAALGGAAIAFFESSQKLTGVELRDLYKKLRWKRQLPHAPLDGTDGHA
jgi:small GTP-binding protein